MSTHDIWEELSTAGPDSFHFYDTDDESPIYGYFEELEDGGGDDEDEDDEDE